MLSYKEKSHTWGNWTGQPVPVGWGQCLGFVLWKPSQTTDPGSALTGQAPHTHTRLHAGSKLARQAPCRLRAHTPGSMQAPSLHARLHAGSALARQAPCRLRAHARLHAHTPGSMQAPHSHTRLHAGSVLTRQAQWIYSELRAHTLMSSELRAHTLSSTLTLQAPGQNPTSALCLYSLVCW